MLFSWAYLMKSKSIQIISTFKYMSNPRRPNFFRMKFHQNGQSF